MKKEKCYQCEKQKADGFLFRRDKTFLCSDCYGEYLQAVDKHMEEIRQDMKEEEFVSLISKPTQ